VAEPITVYNEPTDHLLNQDHSIQQVYPELADPITVTANATAWTLGNYAEIIPADTITSKFHLHYAEISNISANDIYELRLYSGTTLIASVTFTKSASGAPDDVIPFSSPHIPANGQVQAKLACKSASANTADVKLFYHVTP